MRPRVSLAIVAALGACGFDGSPLLTDGSTGIDASIRDDAAMQVRRITIAGRGETLTGFPVWIDLADVALATESGPNAPYFSLPGGAPIPFEIQSWDATGGRLRAWVRVDIDATAGATFDLHAGDSLGPPPSPPTVFAAPFLAVWHFDDVAGDLFGDARDVNDGTPVGGTGGLPTRGDGQLGTGARFDGVDDAVQVTNPYVGDTSHTFSAWVSSTTMDTFGTIVTLGAPGQNRARWFHTRYPNLAAGFYNNDFRPDNTQLPPGFHLVHWVYESGATARVSRLYIDGSLRATSPASQVPIDTQTLAGHIGNAPGGFGACAFEGVLDEVRLVEQIRSDAWIAAEFANQSAPSTFYDVALATE